MWKRKLLIYKLKIRKCTLLSVSVLVVMGSFYSFSQSHRDWSYNRSIYEVNVRQYTNSGTFVEFATHLDRLKDLGVGILWFMPIHPIGEENRLGSLGSYYSVKDYLDVNPEFGTLDEFKALVDTIHRKGMYVMMDWVGNHTSWDNPLTITHPEWYVTDSSGNFIPPPGTNWSDVIQLDYSQQGLRNYMIDAMKFWINEAGIDGFRCDAVSFMPLDFWATAINELKNVKPGILMLAEDDGPQYQTVGFDMTYAWGLHGFGNGILKRIVNGTSNVNELDNYIIGELNNYSDQHYRMYFTSNHDENSWFGTVFEQFGDAAEVFAVLTATFNSMPLIYSGQEAGLNKRLLFFDKDEIEWQSHPFAEMYNKLFHLKKENTSLWNGGNGGEFQRINTTDDQAVFAFVREKDNHKIFAILNLSDEDKTVTLQGTLYIDDYIDVFTNDSVSFVQNNEITLTAWDYKVYEIGSGFTGVVSGEKLLTIFTLGQNYPNPFNPSTTITYNLAKSGNVKLTVYDLLGQEVVLLSDKFQSSGEHKIEWNADGINSGVYLIQLQFNNLKKTVKTVLLK